MPDASVVTIPRQRAHTRRATPESATPNPA